MASTGCQRLFLVALYRFRGDVLETLRPVLMARSLVLIKGDGQSERLFLLGRRKRPSLVRRVDI